MIDWTSETAEVLLNPRFPEPERRRLARLAGSLPPLPGHVWLATSGTTGPVKLVALSRRALLASAEAVNRHLDAGSADVWANLLPLFHVGGLGILARAHRSGARVVGEHDRHGLPAAWSAAAFVDLVAREGATLSALVPAQVHDLVAAGFEAPASLRAVVVGGGPLPEALHARARELRWPLLPSYGATECASQIATAGLASLDAAGTPALPLLPHVEAREDEEGLLRFKSEALFSGYAGVETEEDPDAVALIDPKVDGWWTSEDLGQAAAGMLTVIGRGLDCFKVGGESVQLPRLETVLDALKTELGFPGDAALVPAPDPRLGCVIDLVFADAGPGAADALVTAFNARVLPFERIRNRHRLPGLPRTPLGKLLRADVLRQLDLE